MRFLSIPARRFWLFVSFTAVFAVLVVVLLFGVFQWFFGRSPTREFEALRRNVDPHQLQSWALEILQRFPNATNAVFESPKVSNYGGRLVFSNAPPFLNRIPAFGAVGPEIIISGVDAEAQRHIELVYFYGGWGNGQTILAGSPAFTAPTNSRCFLWAPGVYCKIW